MQPTNPVSSTIQTQNYQNSTSQNQMSGENNAQKKQPKEKTPMCQVYFYVVKSGALFW